MKTTLPLTFDLRFGAMADPIKKQLAAQGISLPDFVLHKFQTAADAIVRLNIGFYIPERVSTSARKKLLREIGAAIKNHGSKAA